MDGPSPAEVDDSLARVPTLRTQRKLSFIINRSLNDTAGTISSVILRKRTAVGRTENPRVGGSIPPLATNIKKLRAQNCAISLNY
jgi:hypothetical protein